MQNHGVIYNQTLTLQYKICIRPIIELSVAIAISFELHNTKEPEEAEGLRGSVSAFCTGDGKGDLLLLVAGAPAARQSFGRRVACNIRHTTASLLSAGCGHQAAGHALLLLQVEHSLRCRWMVGRHDGRRVWWLPAHGVDAEAGGGHRCVASKGRERGVADTAGATGSR